MTDIEPSKEIQFSLVKGGLLYRFFCRSGLCNEDLEPSFPRAFVLASIAWLPLLLLTLLGGRFSGGVEIPFLGDIENHVRLLVALPLLLAGETYVQRLLSPRIKNFVTRNIIRDKDMLKFKEAIESAHRMRDSWVIEISLLIIVYLVGAWLYGGLFASASSPSPTWYATPDGAKWNLTLAGYWLILVSLPIFQFLVLRWYFRIVIWFVFLWRVSRLDLNLLATHSDGVAGIRFLNKCAYSFSYWQLAQGALLSGYIAGQAIHFGGDPGEYKLEVVGMLLLVLASVLLPLAVFAPKLIAAKWDGGEAYGLLASRYTQSFDRKWIRGINPDDEPLLGSHDIQTLADLAHSHHVISNMRTVPFSTSNVFYFAGITLVPLLPLLLFIFSLEDLVDGLIKVLI